MYKVSLILVFLLLAGCADNTSQAVKATDPINIVESVAFASVGHIDFEATLIDESNYKQIEEVITADLEKTNILLSLNNHREDLSVYDYQELVTLDGQAPEQWEMLSSEMSGHHLEGVLIFARNNNPQVLLIDGLSVGEVILNL